MISELTAGLAQLIGDAGIGKYQPTGTYGSADVAVTIDAVPQTPDELIVLSPHPVQDDPILNDSIVAVQIRFRGAPQDPRPIQDRDDAVFDLIQGLQRQFVGGVFVVLAWRQGGGSLGQDQNLRWERASLYYIRVNYPTGYRVD